MVFRDPTLTKNLMAGRRGKKSKFKKYLVPVLKWLSAIIPVCGFIYILYYYKQLDFLKKKPVTTSNTEVVNPSDSLVAIADYNKEKLLSSVKILENEWHSVGGIAIHSMTIENASSSEIKNVEVEFKYLSATQSVVTSKVVTIKTAMPPNKSTKVSGISVGYVNNSVVGCDIKVVNVGL
jgi:hypothetical protein